MHLVSPLPHRKHSPTHFELIRCWEDNSGEGRHHVYRRLCDKHPDDEGFTAADTGDENQHKKTGLEKL